VINCSKFIYSSFRTVTSAMCSPSRNWVVDDTSAWPSSNDVEPIDWEAEPLNREERRHGKEWKALKTGGSWDTRRGRYG
jgi:hypothetical protein